nr:MULTISPECIES: ABC transporter substrate-binding protein [unclassified Pseudomonas]
MKKIRLAIGLLLWATAVVVLSAEQPQRWVSAGGSLTEWIAVLGGQSRLVGVDTTSQHPESLQTLPRIGYQRQLSAEGILTLRPDILVGSEEMGPPPVLDQLRRTGVRVETLSADASLDTLHRTLEALGTWLGRPEEAQRQFARYSDALHNLESRIHAAQAHHASPGVLLLIGGTGDRPLIAGPGTLGDWLIKQAGGINLATQPGYKALSSEVLAGLDPAYIIIADRRLEGAAAAQALLKQNPALEQSQAVREGHLLPIDATVLVGGLGPRLPEVAEHLAGQFYLQDLPEPAAGQP